MPSTFQINPSADQGFENSWGGMLEKVEPDGCSETVNVLA
jgi:hypothetical protein